MQLHNLLKWFWPYRKMWQFNITKCWEYVSIRTVMYQSSYLGSKKSKQIKITQQKFILRIKYFQLYLKVITKSHFKKLNYHFLQVIIILKLNDKNVIFIYIFNSSDIIIFLLIIHMYTSTHISTSGWQEWTILLDNIWIWKIYVKSKICD